jgi:hypothetical protein
VTAQHPETLRSSNEVRDGDRGDGQLGSRLERERWRQDASYAKPGHGSNAGGDHRDDGEQDSEKHQSVSVSLTALQPSMPIAIHGHARR